MLALNSMALFNIPVLAMTLGKQGNVRGQESLRRVTLNVFVAE